MEDERRSHSWHHAEVQLEVFELHTGQRLGRVVDLSADGFMLFSDTPQGADQLLEYRLVTEHAVDGVCEVTLGADCLWSRPALLGRLSHHRSGRRSSRRLRGSAQASVTPPHIKTPRSGELNRGVFISQTGTKTANTNRSISALSWTGGRRKGFSHDNGVENSLPKRLPHCRPKDSGCPYAKTISSSSTRPVTLLPGANLPDRIN